MGVLWRPDGLVRWSVLGPTTCSDRVEGLPASSNVRFCRRNTSRLPDSQRCLVLSNLPQSSDGRSNGSGRWGSEGVGTSGVDFVTGLALPDTDGSSLDGILSGSAARSLAHGTIVILTFPHEGQLYRACWVISIFLTLWNVSIASPLPRHAKLTSFGGKHRNGFRTFRSHRPFSFAWSILCQSTDRRISSEQRDGIATAVGRTEGDGAKKNRLALSFFPSPLLPVVRPLRGPALLILSSYRPLRVAVLRVVVGPSTVTAAAAAQALQDSPFLSMFLLDV